MWCCDLLTETAVTTRKGVRMFTGFTVKLKDLKGSFKIIYFVHK